MESVAQFKPEDIREALTYIDEYWLKLQRFHPHDEGTLVGLPRPYIVPSSQNGEGFEFEEIYYWDSYFIAQAFIGTKQHRLAFDIAEDLLYLTSRSQPPLLTSLLWQLYNSSGNKKWFLSAMDVAKDEYRTVWMGKSQPNWRQVHQGLSRYYDANMLHALAEAESGWDMTSRFGGKCLNYTPVDLNSLLYRYEKDFEAAARLNGDTAEAAEWAHRASIRAQNMNDLMWDEEKSCFFDYNYRTNKMSDVWSLAAFYPMWAGIATKHQARMLVGHLAMFELEGGLTTTTEHPLQHNDMPEQWAYPNGWAPLQLITIEALERYGYHEDARRIARKWLKTNLMMFRQTGHFYEKYNVSDPGQPPIEGVYPSQTGFGWTNAIFSQLCSLYLEPSESMARALVASETTKRVSMRDRLLVPLSLRRL
jgi:alpha,alpha-trehalase